MPSRISAKPNGGAKGSGQPQPTRKKASSRLSDSSDDFVSPKQNPQEIEEEILIDDSSIEKDMEKIRHTGLTITSAASSILIEERSAHEQHRESTHTSRGGAPTINIKSITGQSEGELLPPVKVRRQNGQMTLNPDTNISRHDWIRQELKALKSDFMQRVQFLEEMFGDVEARLDKKQNNTVLWREAASQTEEPIQFRSSETQTENIQLQSVVAEETSEEVGADVNIHNQVEEDLNRHPGEPNNVIAALKRLLGTTTSRPRDNYKIPQDVLTNRKAASELYQRNPKKLVDILLTGSVEVASPSEDQKSKIVENLNDKWGFKTTDQAVGDFDRRIKYGDKVHKQFSILYPITDAEIKSVITAMKDSSAPGPDGITVKQLKTKWVREVLLLPHDFVGEGIHLASKHGGLGAVDFEEKAVLLRYTALFKASEASERAKAAFEILNCSKEQEKLAKYVKFSDRPDQFESWATKKEDRRIDRLEGIKSQGNAAKLYKSGGPANRSSRMSDDPEFFRFHLFIEGK
ncbi:hypothetical protein SNEBB_008500 [Seison nebaliae]|nr:hypothetical protein SNEBB_008500 [Seison nebaliae]